MIYRLKTCIGGAALLAAVTICGAVSADGSAGVAEAAAAGTTASALSSLSLLKQGDYRGAARLIRAGREAAPGDPFQVTLSGLIELDTGDAAAALKRFQDAAAGKPAESLYYFGQAQAQVALGKLAAAREALLHAEQCGGDAGAIGSERAYIGFLSGRVTAEGPGELNAAMRGMAMRRAGNNSAAIPLLLSAVAAGGGDPFQQSQGPLASFDMSGPVSAAAERLPPESAKVRADTALGGDLVLTPDDVPRDAKFAAYQLDGEPLSIVGEKPFTYTWDTSRASNGPHKLSIGLYDAGGEEISRSERTVRIYNTPAASGSDSDAGGRATLREQLWSAMTLKPDRCACSYQLGAAYLALRETDRARQWFTRAAAIRANYRDVRACLAACNGLARAEATLYSGRQDEKCVALTFDDGPKPGVTEPLLDLLVNAHVPATFFVIGKHIQEYPEIARSIAAAGMEIENHSYTHRSLTSLSENEAVQEMLETQAAILAATGKLPRYIRPPGGNWNSRLSGLARTWGLTPCMWSVDVFDSEIIGAQKVAETVLKQAKPGAIVLMHNGKISTLQALPGIVKELRSRGYRFVTVAELARRAAGVRTQAAGPPSTKPHSE